jgi:1-acyl-sn-glycerol-3-phosphate acyltransferase
MSEDRLTRNESEAHAYARERGVSRVLYLSVRACAMVLLRLWFRLRVSGVDNIPARGPAIIAPNHKNFLDPFFVAIVTRRHVRYMAKVELFGGPLAWLLPRLGAFPVRRGGADAEALATARSILSSGGVVVVFAEGTRVQEPDVLGSPHHGAGRLALETGAPIVPAAISGTSHLWRGALPRLKRIRLAFLPAVVPDRSGSHDELAELIDRRLLPFRGKVHRRLRRAIWLADDARLDAADPVSSRGQGHRRPTSTPAHTGVRWSILNPDAPGQYSAPIGRPRRLRGVDTFRQGAGLPRRASCSLSLGTSRRARR